jgi:BirA family biotin operon repressor/biotin-[acetyl-CoA-carboxylase] ligase
MKAKVQIVYKDSVSSTNDEVKLLASNLKDYDYQVIYADEQLAGRGQRENVWHSSSGENLTFSILCAPEYLEIGYQFYLSKAVSIGILNYLRSKIEDVKIKWPNDIFCGSKKMCGILIENAISMNCIKHSVIGIGLNMNQTVFPNDLKDATSLALLSNTKYLLKSELAVLLDSIFLCLEYLKTNEFAKIDVLYHEHLFRLYTSSNFKDSQGIFSGKIIGTLTNGHLVIEDDKGRIRSYGYKEVEFL